MKKALFVVLALLLIAVVPAFAHGDKPPKPTCGEGQITVEESQWVDGFYSCPEGYHSVQWSDKCLKDGGNPFDPRDYKSKEYTPGYWTEPVCREPILGCTDAAAWNYDPEAEVDDQSCAYDVCPNLEGLQEEVPDGMIIYGNGNCGKPLLVADLCPNLEGNQKSVPEGYSRPGGAGTDCLKNVSVSVSASCGRSVDGVVYQLQGGIGISPEGGAIVTFDGEEFVAANTPIWPGFNTHFWSAAANEGFFLVGASEGVIDIDSDQCNGPEKQPPTGADPSLVPLVVLGVAGLTSLAIGAKTIRRKDEV